MRKILYVLLLIILIQPICYSIDWIELKTPKGQIVYLDKDSITKTDKYYFYNIKLKNLKGDRYVVNTVQTTIHHTYAAKIDSMFIEEYSGDYSNITKNQQKTLLPAEYGSVVNVTHKKVQEIMLLKNDLEILVK